MFIFLDNMYEELDLMLVQDVLAQLYLHTCLGRDNVKCKQPDPYVKGSR